MLDDSLSTMQIFEDIIIDDSSMIKNFPMLRNFKENVGDTPLIQVPGRYGGKIWAKIEATNLFGSMKDRTAWALVCNYFNSSNRNLSDELVEYSGGNLAVPLSYLAHKMGVKLTLFLSAGTPLSILSSVREYHAEIITTPTTKGFLGVMRAAFDYAAEHDSRRLLFQHKNACNISIHRHTTGLEIAQKLCKSFDDIRRIDLVGAIGTGGSLMGVSKALKGISVELEVHGVTPSEMPFGTCQPPNAKPKFAGSGGLGHGLIQPFLGNVNSVKHHTVDFNATKQIMYEFFLRTGLRIGTSSAATWEIASRLRKDHEADKIVAIFPDSGTEEEWNEFREIRLN